MTCGVYKIVCLDGNYIGQSTNIEKRYQTHKARLRANEHHCLNLQLAWRKSSDSFRLEIIEKVFNPVDLSDCEQWHLDHTPNLLNTRLKADSHRMTTVERYLLNPEMAKPSNDVRIFQHRFRLAPLDSRLLPR